MNFTNRSNVEILEAAKALNLNDLSEQELERLENDSSNVVPMEEESDTTVEDPEAFLARMYGEAFQYLLELSKNTQDEGAKARFDDINNKIVERVKGDGWGEEVQKRVAVDNEELINYFEVAIPVSNKLNANPQDIDSRKTLEGYNSEMLERLKYHGYPQNWLMAPPAENGASESMSSVKLEDDGSDPNLDSMPDATPAPDTTPAPDATTSPEASGRSRLVRKGRKVDSYSNGLTTYGKVVTVNYCKRYYRVLVNRGTDDAPIHEC